MSTQPEQVLENQLIEQLSNSGYTKVSIPDEATLIVSNKKT
ncbi:complement resistance protein TraT [Winogradskyella psychrotolerans]|nr:complement resistance protein TraT [Winogradskyella psychrotolerans]MBU2921497.1 complement resistance protein TraT [Winogradskyella psychrotolerans]